ncbi:MAG: hypothetical protein HY297_04875 [Thaumarchaeota archaeon]|nr:hypothetical protein [Nitrososphaerota archaeon]
MVNTFLPAIRQMTAVELRSEGFSQSSISRLLGITQASVSLYLSAEGSRAYTSLAALSVSNEEARKYAKLLARSVKVNKVEGVKTLTAIWTRLLGAGSICPAHRSLYPELADCDVCIKEYGPRVPGRQEAVVEVVEAVRILESSPTFVSVMPEVSVNIACVSTGGGEADVVAVPGRIVRVKGRARATMTPEPGASSHMSKVLLEARRKLPDIRACMNLRYDKKMATVLRKLKVKAVEIGGYRASGRDPTLRAIAVALSGARLDFDAVVDLGAEGVEPNVYLFGRSATEVAELAVRASELYSDD